MNLKQKIGLCSCLATFLLASNVSAEDSSVDDLLAMDFEDLMHVEVTVASKKSEKISDAPGIISVVTDEDIRKYGAADLYDVFRRLPGVFTFGPQASDSSRVVSIRAQHTSSIDKHLLVLINGRPFRQGYVAGLDMNSFYRSFPLETIKRVEVIRGPGSVLYGTNAVEGVVNIVTKTGGDELIQEAAVGFGSFKSGEVDYSVGGTHNDIKFFAGFHTQHVDGPHYSSADASGVVVDDNYGNNGTTGLLNAHYNGFEFNLYSMHENYEEVGSGNNIRQRRDMADIGYEYAINEDWKSNFNLTFNGYDYNSNVRSALVQSWNVLGEANISGEVFENANLLLGATLNNYQGERKTVPMLNFNDTHRSFYGQFDYRVHEKVKLIAGLQANSIVKNEYAISHRAGAIVDITDNWGTKLLYSEAFRAPTQLELLLNLPAAGVIGNPNLRPETVNTIDWQVFYNSADYYAAFTYFYTTQEDTITYSPTAFLPDTTYRNLGEVYFRGFELEGKARINSAWNVNGSISHQENELESGLRDTKNTPNFMFKLGVDYDAGEGVSFGVFNSHFGDPSNLKNELPTVADTNPGASSYNHLSANVEFDVKKLWGKSAWPETTFAIFGDNLLEEDYVFGVPVSTNLATEAQIVGRSVYGKLRISF